MTLIKLFNKLILIFGSSLLLIFFLMYINNSCIKTDIKTINRCKYKDYTLINSKIYNKQCCVKKIYTHKFEY